MPSRSHNPERSAWKGRSYKKGGARVADLRDTLDRVGHKVEPPDSNVIHPDSLAQLRAKGGTWAVYENVAMDSADLGRQQFIKYGPGCTFERPPEKCPDTPNGLGWKFKHMGYVDLTSGRVVTDEPGTV